MSIHTEDLRSIAANHGWGVCDLAADELENNEKAYALLFAENAKLREALASKQAPRKLSHAESRTLARCLDGGISMGWISDDEAEAVRTALAAQPAAPVVPTESQILTACEEAGLWPNTAASWVDNGAFRRYHEALNRMRADHLATTKEPK